MRAELPSDSGTWRTVSEVTEAIVVDAILWTRWHHVDLYGTCEIIETRCGLGVCR
jgi:hypothetical protein